MAADMGLGIMAPNPGDQISEDGATEMRTIGATAANAISVATAEAMLAAAGYTDSRIAAITALLWRRGVAASGTDWNDARTPGVYNVTSTTAANSMFNLPEAYPGVMEVVSGGPSQATAFQRYTVYSRTRARTYKRVASSATAWANWEVTDGDMGRLAADTNLDTILPGSATVQSPDFATIANMPTGAGPGFVVTSASKDWPALRVQQFFEYSGFEGSGRYWYRTSTGSVSWGSWRELTAGGGGSQGGGTASANQLRIDDATQRWGGTKKTNGRPMLGVRVDHGLAKFNSIMRPLLEARNIPYTLALSSRHWGHSENAGVTASMVNTWAGGRLCTIANHGADAHQDAVTLDDLKDQIVTGLAELRAQIPNAMIDMWTVPGVGGTGYNGFGSGNSPEAFYGTKAGQLILENHAFSTGNFPSTQMRVLDGKVRQGGAHVTIDSATPSAINTRITEAKASAYGLQLMIHPSQLNLPGMMTTAQLTSVLDNIAAQRDAGDIVVGSSYDLALADSSVAGLQLDTDGVPYF